MFQVSKNASAIRNDQLLDQFDEDVPDEKNTGVIKGAIRITQTNRNLKE